MIIRVINESNYYDNFIQILNTIKIYPDIIDIDGDTANIYFINHDDKILKKLKKYFIIKNKIFINSLLIKDEIWVDDLYSYLIKIDFNKIRNHKLNKLGVN